jgi:hypothetical protein
VGIGGVGGRHSCCRRRRVPLLLRLLELLQLLEKPLLLLLQLP